MFVGGLERESGMVFIFGSVTGCNRDIGGYRLTTWPKYVGPFFGKYYLKNEL